MKLKNGGLAFPKFDWKSGDGMTMRQYYKAAALQGMLANEAGPLNRDKRSDVSKDCAEIADAMIAEDEEAAKA